MNCIFSNWLNYSQMLLIDSLMFSYDWNIQQFHMLCFVELSTEITRGMIHYRYGCSPVTMQVVTSPSTVMKATMQITSVLALWQEIRVKYTRGQATWGSFDEQSVHSSKVGHSCLARQHCWVVQPQPSVSHRVMLRVEVREMKLLASRTATLLLLLPRPHQVWQPTGFLAHHTLPATSHRDIHYYLHLPSLLNPSNLSLPKVKKKTEIVCTVTAKFEQQFAICCCILWLNFAIQLLMSYGKCLCSYMNSG